MHGFARVHTCVLLPLPCRHFHLNQLVRVDGVVTRRTGVYPQLQASRTTQWLAKGALGA